MKQAEVARIEVVGAASARERARRAARRRRRRSARSGRRGTLRCGVAGEAARQRALGPSERDRASTRRRCRRSSSPSSARRRARPSRRAPSRPKPTDDQVGERHPRVRARRDGDRRRARGRSTARHDAEREPHRARQVVLGSRNSPASCATASQPTNSQTRMFAAVPTAHQPCGANGVPVVAAARGQRDRDRRRDHDDEHRREHELEARRHAEAEHVRRRAPRRTSRGPTAAATGVPEPVRSAT